MPSSASSSSIAQTGTPIARRASSSGRNCARSTGSIPSPSLVAGPQLVAEGLDHVVGCHRHVSDAGVQHGEEREKRATHATHLAARAVRSFGSPVVVPKELVGTRLSGERSSWWWDGVTAGPGLRSAAGIRHTRSRPNRQPSGAFCLDVAGSGVRIGPSPESGGSGSRATAVKGKRSGLEWPGRIRDVSAAVNRQNSTDRTGARPRRSGADPAAAPTWQSARSDGLTHTIDPAQGPEFPGGAKPGEQG